MALNPTLIPTLTLQPGRAPRVTLTLTPALTLTRARSMGDLKKSKGMLAEMGIDVEELKQMSETIMNASSTSISAQNQKSPQRSSTAVGVGARSTRDGAHNTARHSTCT